MKRLLIILGVALLACVGTAQAQEVNLATMADGEANRVYLRTGAEYGFVANVGFARALRILRQDALIGGEVMAPWARPDTADYGARLRALVRLAKFGGWQVATAIAPTVRTTRNDLGRMTSLGADLGVFGGYYTHRWFVAGEAGFDWAATTHVTHGAVYRETVYADARDGWYANPGGNYRYGLQAGTAIGRYDVALRVGQVVDVNGEAPLLPFYGTLALTGRW